ncbi:5'/3'-nucleotidase SurE [Actinotalea sp. K2]|uniref:5'/3'-nucleotidase SurE n=1 Tax=Actinotalea sp. K2 TaxID=2939438 RepID=UPI002016FAD1|nr:5'/3'-nucleotidase SurE [Actinotalea sp. K2]MCL3861415.1 5'/3'-nucleotidase SurE [Actinotalea sp. K2]
MRALITNDDGIESEGLAVLARVALAAGYEVTVVAPAHEYSGASASLLGVERDGTLVRRPQPCPGLPEGVPSFAVGASPGLIAFLAAHDAFGPRPDVVLSGVNRGPNTGNAVIHSGTVGAAFSAMTHGIHGLAVSCAAARPRHWGTAERVAAHGLAWLTGREASGGVLNVNVPDVPLAELRGVRQAPLASFGAVQATVDEVEGGDLTVTYAEIDPTTDVDSDAGLLAAGWATLTLLRAPCFDPDVTLPEHRGGWPGEG